MSTPWQSIRSDPALQRLGDLSARVEALASEAGLDPREYPALSDPDWLNRVRYRAGSEFTVIVVGQVSSGKSSFINSLIGRKLLRPSDEPTDGVVSVLLPAPADTQEYAEKVWPDGSLERFTTLSEAQRFLRQQDTPSEEQLGCAEVRFHLHEPWLRHLRIVNTPGLGDRLEAFEKVALRYLREDESDLVVWTFQRDTASNSAEVGVFHDALARRRGAVIGVVTSCLSGHEDEADYFPDADPHLVGPGGVEPWLRQNLGEYLSDIVPYDSHVARRQVAELRRDPELANDTEFESELRRCGYLQIQELLTSRLGEEREHVLEARTASLINRIGAHATAMSQVAMAAQRELLRQGSPAEEQIAAWEKVEHDIIKPARKGMRSDLKQVAQTRAKELVAVMGNSAAEAIQEHFGLVQTLARTAVSWTGICDSAADALNGKIAEAVESGVVEARFHERLDDEVNRVAREHLEDLKAELKRALLDGDNKASESFNVDAGRPAGPAGDVLGDALSGALKGVISAVLKSVTKKLEQRAAQEAAAEAGKQAGKQAAAKSGGAAFAKAAGAVSLVLIPFDVAKLVKDFKKGRDALAKSVRAKYVADRPLYDVRIFDALWGEMDKRLTQVLADARAETEGVRESLRATQARAQEAGDAAQALQHLAVGFSERAGV